MRASDSGGTLATMTTDEDRFAIAAANRRLAADMFAELTQEQWRTPSLCAGWTVREVLAHLVPPAEGFSTLGLVAQVVRYRGNLEVMVDATAREAARQPTDVLVRQLRERAEVRLKPPVTGAAGPMADTAIHLRDAARPLGLNVCPPPASWVPVLEFLCSKPATRGFLPKNRLTGLRLVAIDVSWCWGAGAELAGAAEALALAVAGRPVCLAELSGDGVPLLTARLNGASPG